MDRRTFLTLAGLAPMANLLPDLSWAAASTKAGTAAGTPGQRLLLLIELNGGNDGLNMVVPYADAQYAQLRPNIGIARDQVIQLDEKVGLHPQLTGLKTLFDAGQLAIVQGVGYPHFNRSHFRSIDIWDTASDADVVLNEGWLTRSKSIDQNGAYAAPAVVIGRNPSPVSGEQFQPVVMANAASFVSRSEGVRAVQASTRNAALKHIIDVQGEIEDASRGLAEARPAAPGEFPKNPFGRDASEAARLLIGDPATPIVKIALGGFDNHVNLRGTHDRLMGMLGETLAALQASLTQAGVWDRTLVMTYSEFGRRVQENASRGADHGKGAPMLVAGGAVRGGLYGQHPELSRLDDGDIACTTDFRSVYNTVLDKWWSLAALGIEADRYRPLDLIRS